jgi:hypothetical protein
MSDTENTTAERDAERPSFEALLPLIGAGYELIPLHTPNDLDAKGRPIGKAPFKGWRKDRPLTADEARQHMAEGGNVGVRLRPTDLVVDVDPRNFSEGDAPLDRLQADLGIDLSGHPTVVTGSGGLHIYMALPEPLPVRDTLDDYQGVEFKALGRQVVAPGSVHPDSGRLYEIDPLAEGFGSVPQAPGALLGAIRRPDAATATETGEMSPEQVGELLEGLDPVKFRDHSAWLDVMMGAHHASAGEARDEFVAWSTSDPQYASDAWLIGRRWDSLHADRRGGVTVKTIYKRLIEAGRGDLVNRATVLSDFPDGDQPDQPSGAIDPVKARRQANAAKARKAKIEKGELRKLKAAESREQFAQWLNGRFAYDRSTGRRVDMRTGEAMDDSVFENEHGPGWARSGGKGSLVNAIKTGKAGIDLPSVMMAASFPGKPRRVPIDMGTHEDEALNVWYDTTIEAVEGDATWFRSEVERLFPGDERQQHVLLDYWAARCIDPGRKVRWQLVIESAQGVGKGQMKTGFTTLFGFRNCGTFGVTQMLDKFNGWMVSSANMFGEEIGFGTWKEAKGAYENMKAPLTDDFIAVRPMQRESLVRVPNGTNYVVHRNPGRKFYCPDDDRRICYLRPNPEELDERGAHNQALARHYASATDMAAVRWWLMNVWVKGRIEFEDDMERIAGVGLVRFDDHPPMTDAKRALIRECLRADSQDALDFGELERAMENAAGMDLFSADDVVRLVREQRLDRFDATDEQLLLAVRKWLNGLGFRKHRRNTNGQGLTLYSPSDDARWSAMGAAERERAYLGRS